MKKRIINTYIKYFTCILLVALLAAALCVAEKFCCKRVSKRTCTL